jgi:hypothetical protein
VFFIYIFRIETTSFWLFTIKRPKQEEQRTECSAVCVEDFLISYLIQEIFKTISVAKKSRGAEEDS